MKTKLFQLLILFLLLFYGCKPEDKEPPCTDTKTLEFMLSEEAKSKVPYLKPDFDTLSFASDKGDTLVFVRQPVTYSWYCNYPNMTTNCPGDKHCYENYGAKYTCIKGNGKFEFRHGKEIYVNYSLNTSASKILGNMVELFFNDIHLLYSTNSLVDPTHYSFIGDTIIDGKTYQSSIYQNHEWSFTEYGKGLINKDYGLYQLNEIKKNKIWILIYP